MKHAKEEIIRKADALFARFGLHKTTIDDIAKSLNMGKSSLYYYFKNKEEIFKSVLDLELKKMKISITDNLRNIKSPKEKLKIFAITRMDFLKNNENIRNAIKDEYLSLYDFISEVRKYFDNMESNTVKQIIKEGVKEGVFAVKDILSASQAVVAAIKGMEYKMTSQSSFSKKHLDRVFSVILDGISKHRK